MDVNSVLTMLKKVLKVDLKKRKDLKNKMDCSNYAPKQNLN